MALATSADLVERARAAGHGLASFNVITLEHAEAVVAGAEAAGRPVVLQVSENAVRFHGGRLKPLAAATTALALGAAVDVSLHLDHAESLPLIQEASEAGFSSAMLDASKLAYSDNVAATAAASAWVHEQGMWLEAELGRVGGKPGESVGAHEPGARTAPGEARRYVEETGVDALAVAVGSSHAMTTRTARLDHGLVAELRAALPVPLVLHGSSGVPDDELARAVAAGMVKINVGTALNLAYTGAVRTFLEADDAVVDPRRYLAEAREAMAGAVEHLARVVALEEGVP